MPKAMEKLKSQVTDLLGPKADALLPMFQLLDFLDGVAASLADAEAEGGKLAESPDALKQKEMIMETFRRWDLNTDGFISKDELQRVLALLGVSDTDIATI